MNAQQKKRLVGAFALLIVGVAILPLILDGSGYRERHLDSRIPPAPKAASVVEIEPQMASLADTSTPAAPAAPVEVTAPVKPMQKIIDKAKPSIDPQQDTPTLDEQNVPVAWTLQLASFRDEENARALRTQLLKSGYKVYIRHMTGLVKVFVGPELQRSRLEALQNKLKKDYSLDGIVVRFTTQ